MRRLLLVNIAACLLLFVQYLLGMAVNVSVMIPAQHPGANASDFFSGAASGLGWVIGSGPGWAAAHAAFGLALVVAAIAAVVLARGHGRLAIGRLGRLTSAQGVAPPFKIPVRLPAPAGRRPAG